MQHKSIRSLATGVALIALVGTSTVFAQTPMTGHTPVTAPSSTSRQTPSGVSAVSRPNAGKHSGATSAQDQSFVAKLAQANRAEIWIGKLAETNGGDKAVKDSGKRMVTDHEKLLKSLQSMAASQHMSLPNGPNMEQDRAYARLTRLHGTPFDQEYLKDMLNDHHAAVELLTQVKSQATNPQLRSAASSALPVIEGHLRMFEKLTGHKTDPAMSSPNGMKPGLSGTHPGMQMSPGSPMSPGMQMSPGSAMSPGMPATPGNKPGNPNAMPGGSMNTSPSGTMNSPATPKTP